MFGDLEARQQGRLQDLFSVRVLGVLELVNSPAHCTVLRIGLACASVVDATDMWYATPPTPRIPCTPNPGPKCFPQEYENSSAFAWFELNRADSMSLGNG